MSSGITGVAVSAAKGRGHVAIGCHREDDKQLLQIRAVALGEAVGDGGSRPPSNLSTRGRAVVTAEANRRAVIVKLIELHSEALADRHHHLGEQRASICIEQSVERAPDPVVAHVLHLLGTEAEHPAGEPMHRLLLAVDWFSLDDNGT